MKSRPLLRTVLHLARKPQAGDRIEGTGGARKVRFAGRGKGKSGGYRVISHFGGDDVPVFLLNVFAKGEKVNLSKAERNELKRMLADLADLYQIRSEEKMSKAGERILKSARAARAYARGDVTEGFVAHVPDDIDVRAVRKKLNLTREAFAQRFGLSVDAVKDWEMGRRKPERATRVLLKVIEREPEAVKRALEID